MFNDDDRQLSTPNDNNIIHSFTHPQNITVHTIKRQCRESCENMCHGL